MDNKSKRCKLMMIVIALIINLSVITLYADSSTNKKYETSFKIKTGFILEYNDNIFKLTDSQEEKYNENDEIIKKL